MLHKRAIPTITLSTVNEYSEPLFKELEILKLPYVVSLDNGLFIYQYHNNLSDSIIKTSVIFGLLPNGVITSITLKQTMENSTSAL